MKMAVVTGPGKTGVIEEAQPDVGPRDVLVKIPACGICGTDSMYIAIGGLPPHRGRMPLGHEPAGEIVAAGDEVVGLQVPVDFLSLMSNEITILGSMGYPDDLRARASRK